MNYSLTLRDLISISTSFLEDIMSALEIRTALKTPIAYEARANDSINVAH